MNSPEVILQDQSRRQSKPFDALWVCWTKVSDRAYFVPLRTYALRVLRVISSLVNRRGSDPARDGAYHNSPEIILRDQLRRQREPFDVLWACRTKVSDGVYLAPLDTHALRVLRVIKGFVYDGSNNPAWNGVYHNLDQALSLESVGLNTDPLGDNIYCGTSIVFDKIDSEIKERFVAGQLVFQGAWNAFEIAGEAFLSTGKPPSMQAVRHKFDKLAISHQPLFGLREALYDACEKANTYISTTHPAFKEAVASHSELSISVELLRQFRNGLLHGKIKSLEPQNWKEEEEFDHKTCQTQVELFHAQIRLVLFLLQAIIARVEANHEAYFDADCFSEGDRVGEFIFAVQK